MTRMKKGDRLLCIPCGREIFVDCWGTSERAIWCCGEPMKKGKAKKAVKKK